MATSDTELKSEVRSVTDYSTAVLSDTDLQGVVDVARREVLAESGADEIDFYADINAERALFWATCLFCKIKAGELDGAPMSLGDMDIDTIRAAPEQGGQPVIWLQNARKYAGRVSPSTGMGIRSIARSNRTYGSDDSGTGGTGGLGGQ